MQSYGTHMQGNLLIYIYYIYMYKPIHCSLHDFCLLKIHVSLSFLHPETLVISGESGGCAGTMATLVALELAARAGAGVVALPWLDTLW